MGSEQLHSLVWSFRNKSVAHSQSDLVSTLPVVHLSQRYEGGVGVLAITEGRTLPWSTLEQFRTLIGSLTTQLD